MARSQNSTPLPPSCPDTQWPRWEVFKQDAPGRTHAAVGSVHAADAELALLAARNVFARRPSAVSLWVVPAAAIFSRTAEELTAQPLEPATTGPTKPYLVFRKSGHRRAMTFVEHVGALEAGSPAAALQAALTTFRAPNAVTWWVVPAAAITRSDPDDIDSWFAPAADKTYKQQSAYGTVTVEKVVDKAGDKPTSDQRVSEAQG